MTTGSLPPPPRLQPRQTALFFDVDGTLIEIADTPDGVIVPESLVRLLERLHETTEGAVALVSGRSLAQLDDLFSPLQLSAAGLHGLEARNVRAGSTRTASKAAIFDRAVEMLENFAASRPGVLVENKGLTLALHYRRAPDQKDPAGEIARRIADESDGDFIVLEGKMVYELKPPTSDKGKAIAMFMDESPFSGRQAFFAGDDITDEAGFRAMRDMRGVALYVGAEDRPTQAQYKVESVPALHSWLAQLVEG